MRACCLPIALLAASAWAQSCLPYNRTVTIAGKLEHVDENGYRQWIGFRPDRPICAVVDPKDELTRAQSDVDLLQVLNDKLDVWHRLEKLVGNKVTLQGKLLSAITGYHRTSVMIELVSVEPADASGRAALLVPDPKPPAILDVPAYDVVIHAAERLTKEAMESGSNRPLTPGNTYVPHWVTGGDIVYANCRKGYKMMPGPVTPPDAAQWDVIENACAFNGEGMSQITVRFQCVREK